MTEVLLRVFAAFLLFFLASLQTPIVDSLKTVTIQANPVKAAACEPLLELLVFVPSLKVSPRFSCVATD